MWRRVCRLDEVPRSGMKEFMVDGGTRILIHDGSVLTCLEHLWQFDVRTGAPLGDAETGLSSYRLKEEGGALHVWIERP